MVVADGIVGFGSVGLEMKARARSSGGDSRYDSIWPPLSSSLVVFFWVVVLIGICLFLLKALGEEDQG